MNKVRSDANWNKLSPEQLETLDHWLFEEKLSYREVVTKAGKELGYQTSYSGLRRYYRRRSQERAMENLAELMGDAAEMKGAAGDAETLRQAAMKLLAAQAFQQVRETPEDASKWGPAVKMMVQNDRNETIREGQRIRERLRLGDQEVRREAIEFGRQKFEFDIVARAVRALPELQRLAAAINDPDPRRYSDRKCWGEARDAVFGPREEPGTQEEKAPSTKHQTPIQMTNDQTSQCPMPKEAPNPKLPASASTSAEPTVDRPTLNAEPNDQTGKLAVEKQRTAEPGKEAA